MALLGSLDYFTIDDEKDETGFVRLHCIQVKGKLKWLFKEKFIHGNQKGKLFYAVFYDEKQGDKRFDLTETTQPSITTITFTHGNDRRICEAKEINAANL